MSETAGVESSLFSKVGPLPAWLWGVIIVGGYFGYEHLSSRNAATATDTGSGDTTDDTSGDGGNLDGTDYGSPSTDTGSGGDYGYSGSTTVQPVTTFATNQQWLIAAIDSLRAQGDPAGPVTTALTLYIRGSKITAQDAGYVNAAIHSIGPPPEPLPINTGTPTPTGGGTTTGGTTGSGVPGAPQIAVSNRTKTSITIKWASVPHAVNYQVVAGDKVHIVSAKSYTLSGLKSGTSHRFYVRARNSKGQLGPESNHLTVKTK